MARNKTNSSRNKNTWLPWVIAFVIVVFIVGYVKMKTIKHYQMQQMHNSFTNVTDSIGYTIPPGWTVSRTNMYDIDLHSADYTRDEGFNDSFDFPSQGSKIEVSYINQPPPGFKGGIDHMASQAGTQVQILSIQGDAVYAYKNDCDGHTPCYRYFIFHKGDIVAIELYAPNNETRDRDSNYLSNLVNSLYFK